MSAAMEARAGIGGNAGVRPAWLGNGHDKDLEAVWAAVIEATPVLAAHITGPKDHGIGLDKCICAFHEHAVRLNVLVYPDLLLTIFNRYPEGAFGHRIGTKLLAEDVAKLWDESIEGLRKKKAEEAKKAAELASYLTISDEPWDEDALPLRPWLGPPYLMRGEITVLHGPGAAGKSLLIVVWAVALALGQAFGRLKPKQRYRVLLTNFEDKAVEQMRRISAALRFFGATPADLKGWLYRVSLGPKGNATMFELDENGQVRTTTCWEVLESACETISPDAVAIDPLIAINAVPESDNTLMRRVMTFMRMGCAERFDCALTLAHHDNKSGGEDEDSDQSNARGAGDIINAARFELAVKKMSLKQAEAWGIDPAKRGSYFRVGSVASKRNYAAPEESEWFERLAVAIGGEAVVRCVPWEPPSAHLDDEQTTQIVAAVEKGTKGGPYSSQLTNTDRSLAPVLDDLGITKPAMQRKALKNLIDTKRITRAKWYPPGFGKAKTLTGLRAASGLPYAVDWVQEDEP
jgi:hypothetical protein